MKLRNWIWAMLAVLALCFAVDLLFDEDHGADFGKELDAYSVPQPRKDFLPAVPVPTIVPSGITPQRESSHELPALTLILPSARSIEGPAGLSPPRIHSPKSC